jgi:Site-specific recombinase XerD
MGQVRLCSRNKEEVRCDRYDADQIGWLIERSRGMTVEDMRDHTMILLTVNTGLRRSEIANLKIKDIHADSLRVEKGKGRRQGMFIWMEPRELF